MAFDRTFAALTLGIIGATVLAFGQGGSRGVERESAISPSTGEVHVNAGFVLGTDVRWKDSALYTVRHRPGLDLLRSGRFAKAATWFERRITETPEDLFMNRGLYEASALSGAPTGARAFYAARAKAADDEHRVVGPVETLGTAALIGLTFGQPVKGSTFERANDEEKNRIVLRRLYGNTDAYVRERSTALWCATTWQALGYTGPARKVLREFLARLPSDTAARYTLARYCTLGEIPEGGKWPENDPLRADSSPDSASALKEAEIILNRSPEFYPALWIAGKSAVDLGDRAKARKYLTRYVAAGGTKYKLDAERLLRSL